MLRACVFLFFFLMIRLPPRSTLFPYTTSSDLGGGRHRVLRAPLRPRRDQPVDGRDHGEEDRPRRQLGERPQLTRSEEHTSELQSRQYLVCRLLLEKKKNEPLYNVRD